MERKTESIIVNIKKMAKEEDIGELSTDARLLIYEKTAVPTILYNLEVWTQINQRTMERIERIQAKIIKRILELPESTPYWGLIKETGVWPMEQRIKYQRLMLYENMVKSGRKRLGGEIMINQREEGKENYWYGWS